MDMSSNALPERLPDLDFADIAAGGREAAARLGLVEDVAELARAVSPDEGSVDCWDTSW